MGIVHSSTLCWMVSSPSVFIFTVTFTGYSYVRSLVRALAGVRLFISRVCSTTVGLGMWTLENVIVVFSIESGF